MASDRSLGGHRAFVDAVASIARGERTGLVWRDVPRGEIVALAFANLTPILPVTAIATFPGEWLEENRPRPPDPLSDF